MHLNTLKLNWQRLWRSFEVVEFATREWVGWFNTRGRLEPIGNIPPAEAGQHRDAMMEQSPMAA